MFHKQDQKFELYPFWHLIRTSTQKDLIQFWLQDAHELLCFLLDALHQDTNGTKFNSSISCRDVTHWLNFAWSGLVHSDPTLLSSPRVSCKAELDLQKTVVATQLNTYDALYEEVDWAIVDGLYFSPKPEFPFYLDLASVLGSQNWSI